MSKKIIKISYININYYSLHFYPTFFTHVADAGNNQRKFYLDVFGNIFSTQFWNNKNI